VEGRDRSPERGGGSAYGAQMQSADDEELRPFYEGACGFAPTPAGLIGLAG
jgi:hypothetical protein